MIRLLFTGYIALFSLSLFALAAILMLRLMAGDLSESGALLTHYGMLFAIAFGSAAMAFLLNFVND